MPKSRGSKNFEFDYNRNTIFYGDRVISLSPHEADILRVLLNNRARPTPIGTLIQRVYGGNEPDAASISIRVAIHSLRKKIKDTGMNIQSRTKVGYEIDATHIPELNRRLTDKILLALNMARASDDHDIARHLEAALELAEMKREKWLRQERISTPPLPRKIAV